MKLAPHELAALIKKYDLDDTDIWKPAQEELILVSRRGVLKIMHEEKLSIWKSVHFHNASIYVTSRVFATEGDDRRDIEATGEASPENTTFKFPLAVAEKRSESRAVLMYIGVYHKGVIGESELDQETEANEIYKKRREQGTNAVAALADHLTSGAGGNPFKKKNKKALA